jgi:hypothetical protein
MKEYNYTTKCGPLDITESVPSQYDIFREETKGLPVGQEDWSKETPDVEQHTNPTGYYTHPHCDFRPTYVDIVRVGSIGDVGYNIPARS